MVAHYGEDLRPALLAFVKASGRRARLRQTVLAMAAIAFAIVAAIATFSSIAARRAEQSAEANYRTARSTVDGLIGIIASGLRDLQGVSIKTVDSALKSINGSVDRLAESAAKNDPTFDATRASMLYEFAKTYQRSQQAKALGMAEESLRYRRDLARRFPRESELQFGFAASLEQVGDLNRAKSPDDARRNADAILPDPEARDQKARSLLAPDVAQQVEKDPEGAMSAEKDRIEAQVARLQAGTTACLSDLTESLRRTARAREGTTQ